MLRDLMHTLIQIVSPFWGHISLFSNVVISLLSVMALFWPERIAESKKANSYLFRCARILIVVLAPISVLLNHLSNKDVPTKNYVAGSLNLLYNDLLNNLLPHKFEKNDFEIELNGAPLPKVGQWVKLVRTPILKYAIKNNSERTITNFTIQVVNDKCLIRSDDHQWQENLPDHSVVLASAMNPINPNMKLPLPIIRLECEENVDKVNVSFALSVQDSKPFFYSIYLYPKLEKRERGLTPR